MGFECTICCVPKFKDTTVDEFVKIREYFRWKNNPWNFEINESSGKAPYPTFEEYCGGFMCEEDFASKFYEIDKDKVAYYESLIPDNVFESCLDYWCSNGKLFDYDLRSLLNTVEEGILYDGFTDEIVNTILDTANAEVENKSLKKIIVKRINGLISKNVVIQDEYGELYNITGKPIFIKKSDDDDDFELNAFTKLRDVMLKLKNINKEENLIFYEVSE